MASSTQFDIKKENNTQVKYSESIPMNFETP